MEEAIYPDGQGIPFISEYFNWIENYYRRDYCTYLNLQHLVGIDTLVSNTYTFDSFELALPNQKRPLQINKGCKAMKILAKIAKAFDIPFFEEFRLKHSMVLNQKSFKGTLCLSIHPLDYMTMSDTDYNWDSCMSWQKPGEYREGTVEMMNSEFAVVAYLKGDDDMIIYSEDGENYTWSNKRWRELFVVSPDFITHIKGYPYKDRILERELLNWLLELAAVNTPEATYDRENPMFIGNYSMYEYKGEKLAFHFCFNLMYDDFFENHVCYINPAILQKKNKYNQIVVEFSGATECLECGRDCSEDSDDFDTSYLICPECAGELRCGECGDIYDIEEMCTLEDGTHLCSWCYDRYAGICEYCETSHRNDNLNSIYMYHNGECYEDNYISICDACLNGTDIQRHIGEIEYKAPRSSVFRPYSYNRFLVDTKNFTDEGFEMFGYFGQDIENLRQQLKD